MGIVDLGGGGGASGFAKNQLAKFKDKRAKAKFNKKYSGAKSAPGGPNYLSGYLSTDRSYSNADRVSYEMTDLYPNIDLGFNIRITDRLAWTNEYDNTIQSIFLGDDDRFFRYSFDHGSEYSDTNYEDPTILGFNVMINVTTAPLFDFAWVYVPPPPPSTAPAQEDVKSPTPKVVMTDPFLVKKMVWDKAPNDDEKVEKDVQKTDRRGRDVWKTVKKDGEYVVGGTSGIYTTETLMSDAPTVYEEVFKIYFDEYHDSERAKQKIKDDEKARQDAETAAQDASGDSLSNIPKGCASYWFFKYSSMDKTMPTSLPAGQSTTWQRFLMLQEFKDTFLTLIPREFPPTTYRRPFYIQEISGLDKLSNKFVDYKKDFLTFTVYEDIGLRITYLAELYNNIIYSYQHGRATIPENLLRFDLLIKVADKRVFNRAKTSEELSNMNFPEGTVQKIKNFYTPAENAYIIYSLHDCLLDFSASQPHKPEIINGGLNAGADYETSIIKFNVMYKSVSKIFYSPIIGPVSPVRQGTYYIDNKNHDGYGVAHLTPYNSSTDAQFPKYNRTDIQDIKFKKGDPLAGTGFFDRLKSSIFGGQNIGGGLLEQVGDKMFDGLANAADGAFNAVLQKGREARGKLIGDLTDGVTGGKFVAEIFPANVYDINLDQVAGDGLGNQTLADQLLSAGQTLAAKTAKAGLKGLSDLTSF